MKLFALGGLCALFALAPLSAQTTCSWASFDSSRINYGAGTLTGTAHVQLRSIITANGGKVATPLNTLTLQNLLQHRVFYTSLLHASRGTLSSSEQQALQTFVRAGRTLIVSGDAIGTAGYESFTKWLGVTGWKRGNTTNSVTITAAHPITAGITSVSYALNGLFTVPSTAKVLARDNSSGKNPFMIVIEGASGISGRVLVLGDHNLFTDSYVARAQNRALAANIAKWACGGACGTKASWSNYGTGWRGTSGIPTLTASANPVLGNTFNVLGSNSSGKASVLILVLGAKQIAVKTPFDGTLLASLDLLFGLGLPTGGITLPLAVPNDPGLCGSNLFLQGVQLDSGASKGLAFSPGLKLVLGS